MAQKILRALSSLAGAALILAAVYQWATYDYPDINPFWPGAIFAPGVIGQALNYLIVCALGVAGWSLVQFGRSKSNAQPKEQRNL